MRVLIGACFVLGVVLVVNALLESPPPPASVTKPPASVTTPAGDSPSVTLNTTSTSPSSRATITPSNTPTSSNTTTTKPVDVLEVRYPVTQFLPHDAPLWNITYRLAAGRPELAVTLTPVFNRPDQAEDRTAALRAAKAEALAYLASTGADAASYTVVWRPAEAGRL